MNIESKVIATAANLMVVPDRTLMNTASLREAIHLCRPPCDLAVVLDQDKHPIGYINSSTLLEGILRKLSLQDPIEKIVKKDFALCSPHDLLSEDFLNIGQAPMFVCQNGCFQGVITHDCILSHFIWRSGVFKGFQPLMEKYECILNNCTDSILVFDGAGTVVWGNAAAQDIIGQLKLSNVYEKEWDQYFFPSIVRMIIEDKQPHTILQRKGNGHNMLVSGNPIFDESGALAWIVTAHRDIDYLISQINPDFCPVSQELLGSLIEPLSQEAEKLRQSYEKKRALQQNNEKPKTVISSKNKKMQYVIQQANRIAKVDSSVLLLGESGVGKDMLATSIHQKSMRRDASFVRVNCGAIPENLFESELFGYEQGAFTGAKKQKIGFFELANHGTLFLDEIAEMPLPMQVKLLHVLQNHSFYRVGGSSVIDVDVRIISATNKDLGKMVSEGNFREDLYYRLNVIPLHIPPMRERREDIPTFIMHFLQKFNQHYQKECQFSIETMQILINYSWPGNVRQLENTIERLVLTAENDVIYPYELPPDILPAAESGECFSTQSLAESVKQFERKVISDTLELYGNISKAAEVLCVDRSTIYRKLGENRKP